MNTRPYLITVSLLLGGMILSACGGMPAPPGAVEADATEVPIVKADTRVIADGRLMPRESVTLAFVTNGEIAEVLVEEGDQVKAGDVLARLGNQEQLQANIATAELELINARDVELINAKEVGLLNARDVELLYANQAFNELDKKAEIARIEAQHRISDATRAVRDAKYQLDNYTIPRDQADLDAIEATVLMKERLDEARAAFEPHKYKSQSDSTRERLKDELDQAQSDYNSAVRRLEYEIQLSTAEAELDRALRDYEDVKDGPRPEDIDAAEARISAAEAGITAAEARIVGAEARIVSAEAALVSANAALDNLELVATIDGMITDLDMIVGEQVNATEPVITITDFSQWYVETDNLTEIEVVDVSDGQVVTIAPDALPDLELSGVVDKISDTYEEKRGDVTYTVRIKIDEIDPRLRWGMTVIVTFED